MTSVTTLSLAWKWFEEHPAYIYHYWKMFPTTQGYQGGLLILEMLDPTNNHTQLRWVNTNYYEMHRLWERCDFYVRDRGLPEPIPADM